MAPMENGICILCGQKKKGIPARPDTIIGAARRLRETLKLQPKHTIACSGCFPECGKKRAEFEKRRKTYRIGAALFFLLMVGGSTAYGGFGLRAVFAGIVGAVIVALLPYAKYFPKFEPS